MQPKKNPGADLERQRTTFLLVGLVVSLSVVYFAFEYSFAPAASESRERVYSIAPDEVVQITRQEQAMLPPPPPPKLSAADIIEVVENQEDISQTDIDEEQQQQNQATNNDPNALPMSDEETSDEPFIVVEQLPVFPGGDYALLKFIATNTQYIAAAREKGIQGVVLVRFVVNKDGTVDRVSIERSVDPLLDKEAMRVVSLMPRWEPARQRGKKVAVWYTLPFNFRLK